MNKHAVKTAGIIIVGNEILSGKVHDTNSHYLTVELRELGVDVMRISVIPDEVEAIAEEAASFSAAYDHVFTTGGVGPTHDDVTMQGIAKGFGVQLVRDPGLEALLAENYLPLNDAVLKMSDLPEGSQVILNEGMEFPVVTFRNIFIFPGIPDYLKKKFPFIKERLRSSSFFIQKIYLKIREADVADLLSHVEAAHDGLNIGSYPIVDNIDFNLIVTVESRDKGVLENSFSSLLKSIPDVSVIKTD